MTASSGNDAVENANRIKSYDQGYCLRYVRDPCWRVGSLYASAIEAWNGARDKHPGDRTPPKGAPLFYRGGQYGHVVIAKTDGRQRGTDCRSATQVNDEAISWPETAWGYTYLGWTGDLNGVDLPLGGDDDMPLTDKDIEKIAKRVNAILGDYDSEGDPEKGTDGDRGDVRLRQVENTVRRVESKVDKILGKNST